jgi:hypothetical protein
MPASSQRNLAQVTDAISEQLYCRMKGCEVSMPNEGLNQTWMAGIQSFILQIEMNIDFLHSMVRQGICYSGLNDLYCDSLCICCQLLL